MDICDQIGCQFPNESQWCTHCGMCREDQIADASAFFAEDMADQRCRGKPEWSYEHTLDDVKGVIRAAEGMEPELQRVAIEIANCLPIERSTTTIQMRHIAGTALLEAGNRTRKPISAIDAARAVGLEKAVGARAIPALSHRFEKRTAPDSSAFVENAVDRLVEFGAVPRQDRNVFLEAGLAAMACDPHGATSQSLARAACVRWAVEMRFADEKLCIDIFGMADSTYATALARIDTAASQGSASCCGSGGSLSRFARALEKNHRHRWRCLKEAEALAAIDMQTLEKIPTTDQHPELRRALQRIHMLHLALLLRAERRIPSDSPPPPLRVDLELALSVTECRLGSLPQLIGIIGTVNSLFASE